MVLTRPMPAVHPEQPNSQQPAQHSPLSQPEDDARQLATSADSDDRDLKALDENPTQPATSIASLQMAEEQIAELTRSRSDLLEGNDSHE
jgi:hypothetical protein